MKEEQATETKKKRSTDETEIRQLIDGWAKALRAKDIDGVMSHYAPDILVFDIAPPLLYRGANAYRKNFEEWFATWQGPIGYEIRDATITVGDTASG
jgi:ketosteroid isomerase-like protein